MFWYLGSNVVGGTAKRGGKVSFLDFLPAHAEICQLTMTFLVQKNVIQFNISVRRAASELLQGGTTSIIQTCTQSHACVET